MGSSTPLTTDEQQIKAEQVRKILSGLKTVADFSTNPQGRGAIVQRIGSAVIANHVQQHEHEQELAKAAKEADTEREPLAIAAFIESRLGPDWITYEPETIIEEAPVTADELVKALCVRHVLYDHTPFTDWHVFEKIAVAFNGRIPDFETTQDLAPYELAWAVCHMRRIDPLTQFSEEVKNYIALNLHNAGYTECPSALVACKNNLKRLLSDYGHEVAYESMQATGTNNYAEALAVQADRRAICTAYVSHKNAKLTKELESL